MTKFLLSCLIVCITISAHAQIKKNAISLGGDFRINGKNTSDVFDNKDKSIQSDFSISIGTAVKENTVLGLNFGITPKSERIFPGAYPDSSIKFTSMAYSVGAFYRKYKPLAKDLYFFAEVNASYSHYGPYKSSMEALNDYQGVTNNIYASFRPGISYRLYKKFYVEAHITVADAHYSQTKMTHKDQSSQASDFALSTFMTRGNTLNSLGLGFRFII